MSRFPVKKPVLPSDMKGQINGIVDRSLLRNIKPTGQLHHIAAKCWEAMRTAAWADGVWLSLTQGYRTYKEQEVLFRSRYTKEVLPGQPTKRWNGEVWYQRPKTAMAAVPGTSNHGLALAVDTAIDKDGDQEFEWPPKSLDNKAIAWLLKNADKYGFAWELQSEPWHLVYVTGDKIPPAVNQAATSVHAETLSKDLLDAMELKLRKGSGKTKEEKAAVVWLQTFLNKADLKVLVDGDFGPKTEEAVKAFQRKNIDKVGIVDGVVSNKTWEALTR
jgi:hypothetical protein